MLKPIIRTVIHVFLLGSLTAGVEAQCNSVPIAINDSVDYFGRLISVEPMLNDRELDGEALRLAILSHNCGNPPLGAPLSVLNDNGTVRLVPSQQGAPTICTIHYRIEDERGFTASAQILVQLNAMFLDGFETGNTTNWSLVTSGGGVEP